MAVGDGFNKNLMTAEQLAAWTPFDQLSRDLQQDLAAQAGQGTLTQAERSFCLPAAGQDAVPYDLSEQGSLQSVEAANEQALWIPGHVLRRAYLQAPEVFLNHPDHAHACALQQRLSRILRCRTQFGNASEALLSDLETELPVRAVPGGAVICHQGADSDFLMIVLTGYIRPSLQKPQGQQLLPSIGPGQTVGELGLILGQARSATLTAARDSEVLVMSAQDYQSLLRRHPEELNRLFCTAIHRHLSSDNRRSGANRPGSLAILALAAQSAPAAALARQVADNLAQALGFLGRVGVVGEADRAQGSQASAAYFHELEQGVDVLLYVADGTDAQWRQRCIRQADHVVMIAPYDDPAQLYPDEVRLREDPGLAMKDKSLLLIQPTTAERPQGAAAWRALRPDLPLWHLRPGHAGDAGRVARMLVGQGRGVVLGGGGARGFAHLGVLKALQDQGLAVDMVGGNSMGALIGAQFVQGKPLDQILIDTRRFARGGEFPTLPVISLFSGYRVRRDLERLFAGWTLEETWIPFFSVSCDLSAASVRVHDQGSMSDAVLASNSPAGLLPPMVSDGHLLVDGAVLNNVPVDVMRQRIGSGHVLAVDVNIREELTVDRDLRRLSPFDAIRRWVLRRRRLPSLGEILVRAGIVGGISHRDRVRGLADLYIEPPVSQFPLIAYGQAEAIAAVGEASARQALEQSRDAC
jgi:NTE family protein/lysophospholipid hydrolase